MVPQINSDDPFVKLAQNLGELEIVIGERARPAIAEVRAGLRDAIACRERGDMLAAIAGDLDPEEGAMMRFIAERFTAALGAGDKGDAKTVVDVMRHKAGDPK